EEKEKKKDKISQVRKKATQKDRPVVVISNDKQNKYSEDVIVALISSQLDKIYYFEPEIALKKKSKILTDQILTIDKSRLGEKVGALNSEEVMKLEKALHVVLSLRYCRRSGFTAESWLLLQKLAKKEGVAVQQLLEKMGQIIIDNTPEFLEFCKKSNGLVFFGPIGSGKTAILAMLANELPGENKYATFPCQLPWAEKGQLDFSYSPSQRLGVTETIFLDEINLLFKGNIVQDVRERQRFLMHFIALSRHQGTRLFVNAQRLGQ
ncbi:30875_t:CDS:2, partial [Racocetra persica]